MFSRLYGVLLPFFVSFLLAYLLSPVVDFFQVKCHLKNRILSVLVTLLLFVAVLTGAIAALVPVVSNEVESAAAGIEQYFADFDADRYFSQEVQDKFNEVMTDLDATKLLSYPEVRDALQNIAPKVAGWLSGGLSMMSELLVWIIGLMYLIFLLIDFPKIQANWSKYIPERYRPYAITLMQDMDTNMNAYFRGQALVALCVGILFSIGFALIGLPMGVAMGLIIGLLNLVPYMQALGIPPCILLCLVQSAQTGQPVWLTLLMMAAVFVVVQGIQDMVLTPKIMGKVTGMGPAAILLSLSIWGALLGLIGMIIALPMTSLIISYYKHYVLKEQPAEPTPKTPQKNTADNPKKRRPRPRRNKPASKPE